MTTFNLSYIIATYNRLPFLKITLEKIINERQPDEELILVDGNSTDGSKEYIQQLFEQEKIHQFVSEPDKNQAHAWNKAMLMARGTLIKKIIDDDVFCYEAIRKCKAYMLENPQVDVVISNDLTASLYNHLEITKNTRRPQFEKWSKGLVPSFTFGDVHMLIRRSALSYIGLYNTSFTMMDWEYSLRVSYLKANIVYYTGYNALNVAHQQTVTFSKNSRLINGQGKRGEIFYEYEGDSAETSYWSKLKIFIGKLIYSKKSAVEQINTSEEEIDLIYDHYYKYINALNRSEKSTFFESH